jgi:hypothetical protein
MAIHEAVKGITGMDANIWYLDDGTLIGDADLVKRNVKRLIDVFDSLGLKLNPKKCELYPLNHSIDTSAFNEVIDGIKILTNNEFDLLGSPITEEAQAHAIQAKIEQLNTLLQNLDCIDQHQAFFLLTNYLCIPKLTYIMRASPIYKQTAFLQTIDTKVSDKLEQICNVKLDDSSRNQAALPVRNGGIGLRKCSDLALSCYLSSLNACASLIEQIASSSPSDSRDWQDAQTQWDQQHPGKDVKGKISQRGWDEVIIQEQVDLLMQGDQYRKARLKAATARHSGAWLSALPHANIGTLLSPEELRIALALRLGCTVCERVRCRCGAFMDRLGLHGLSCHFNAGRYSRHCSLNHIIQRTLQRINIPSMLEPSGLNRSDGKRPDGLTLIPWSRGKALIWDVTVTDTFCASRVMDSASSAGCAAAKAELNKTKKYEHLSDRYHFQPVAFETTGAWGPATNKFLTQLRRKLVETSREPKEAGYFAAAISIAIMRGNAASILGCLEEK